MQLLIKDLMPDGPMVAVDSAAMRKNGPGQSADDLDPGLVAVCSTNAIESVSARIPAVGAGALLNEAAALKCVYLAVMSLNPTGRQGRRRWTIR